MSEWIKEHPEAVWFVSTAIFGAALRWLRGFIRKEVDALRINILQAIEQKKYATSDAVAHELSEIRADIGKLGSRLDEHLERCPPLPRVPNLRASKRYGKK